MVGEHVGRIEAGKVHRAKVDSRCKARSITFAYPPGNLVSILLLRK
jgi:hypothetical protein